MGADTTLSLLTRICLPFQQASGCDTNGRGSAGCLPRRGRSPGIALTCLAAVFLLCSGIVRAEQPPAGDPPVAPAQPEQPMPNTPAEETPPEASPTPGRPAALAPRPLPRVELEIGYPGEPWGRVVLELEDLKAPITVRNFLRYVDQGFYNGTIFHRIVVGPDTHNFVQGGAYVTLTDKRPGAHEPIRNESRSNRLKNLRGTIAMARGSAQHSATTQFFINLQDNPDLDYENAQNWGYCVFGKVIEGLELFDRMKDLPLQAQPLRTDEISQPVTPPMILKARRLPPPSPPETPANSEMPSVDESGQMPAQPQAEPPIAPVAPPEQPRP